MTIAFVGQWTSAQFVNNTGGTLAGRTSTAGSHVDIGYSTSQTSSPTVSHSQAGTVQIGKAHESTAASDSYGTRYVENIAGGASHTVTLTTVSGQYSALHAMEHSGLLTSSSLDKAASGTGTDTTNPFDLTSGATATTAQANELVVGVGGIATNSSGTVWSGQGGYTLRGNTTDGNVSSVSAMVSQIISATGTPAAAMRDTDAGGLAGGNGQWLVQTVTYKDVTAGGGSTPPGFQRKRSGLWVAQAARRGR